MPSKTQAPTAYSYIRFSSPVQALGDSLRRQKEIRDAWLARSGAVLDTNLTLRDDGVSAFTGDHKSNPDRHALAAFLELVRCGRIQRGSYLIVESLDRLSREHIQPALRLFLDLLHSGVRIVQLLPVEQVFDDKSEVMQLMMAMMELSRGNSESRVKSERVGAAWKAKKLSAKNGEIITRRAPGWLRVKDGRFVADSMSAETIRLIYDLAIAGHGIGSIVKRLNADEIPTISHHKKKGKFWGNSSVGKILGNRAVLGEYQPYKGPVGKRDSKGKPLRKPDGKPVPNYYPAIITEEKWLAVRAALGGRRTEAGRPKGGRPNLRRLSLFTHLWFDARDGSTLYVVDKGAKKSSGPVIVSHMSACKVKGSTRISFPLAVFEDAILDRLREIDAREILPEANKAADRVLSLEGRVMEMEERIATLKAQMIDGGDIAPLVDALREMQSRWEKAAKELADAKREASTPLSGAWSQTKTLAKAIADAPDQIDARTRLRGSLRRIVESIWCLFAFKGSVRLAAVQIWFAGGAHRDYLIVHRAGHANANARRDAETVVDSIAWKDKTDFRKGSDMEKVLKFLNSVGEKLTG